MMDSLPDEGASTGGCDEQEHVLKFLLPLLEPLYGGKKRSPMEERKAVADYIQSLGEEVAEAVTIELIRRARTQVQKRFILERLSELRMRTPSVMRFFRQVLLDKELPSEVRGAALRTCGSVLRPGHACRYLDEALYDANDDIRRQAVHGFRGVPLREGSQTRILIARKLLNLPLPQDRKDAKGIRTALYGTLAALNVLPQDVVPRLTAELLNDKAELGVATAASKALVAYGDRAASAVDELLAHVIVKAEGPALRLNQRVLSTLAGLARGLSTRSLLRRRIIDGLENARKSLVRGSPAEGELGSQIKSIGKG